MGVWWVVGFPFQLLFFMTFFVVGRSVGRSVGQAVTEVRKKEEGRKGLACPSHPPLRGWRRSTYDDGSRLTVVLLLQQQPVHRPSTSPVGTAVVRYGTQ